MNRYKKNAVIVIEFKEDINERDINNLIEIIDSIFKSETVSSESFENDKYILKIALTEDYDVIIPTSHIEYQPYFRKANVNHPDYYYDHMDVNVMMMIKDDGTSIIKNPRCFFFKSKDDPDRIKSIINSINTAKKQLSSFGPGLIFVDHNVVNQYTYETDMTRIKPLINDIIRNNSSISCVILTSTIINRTDQGTSYHHHGKTYVNENPRFPVPDELKWMIAAF
jgi:hypothetical protein